MVFGAGREITECRSDDDRILENLAAKTTFKNAAEDKFGKFVRKNGAENVTVIAPRCALERHYKNLAFPITKRKFSSVCVRIK